MRKHPFDPVSFLFGMLFTVVGVYLATGNTNLSAFENGRAWPLFVVVAGLLFLVPALSRVGRRSPAQPGPITEDAAEPIQHPVTGDGREPPGHEADEAPLRSEDDDETPLLEPRSDEPPPRA